MTKIYLIIEEEWNGFRFDYYQTHAFTTEESRNKEYERLENSKRVREALSYIIKDETILDENEQDLEAL